MSVRMASYNFKFGRCFISLLITQQAIKMTCEVGATFVDELKEFFMEKSRKSSRRREKMVLAQGNRLFLDANKKFYHLKLQRINLKSKRAVFERTIS